MAVKELDVGRANRPPRRGQGRSRDRAFEFADVAGPMVRRHQVLGFRRELLGVKRQAVGRTVARQEAIGQHRNVDGAFAQRRQADRKGVDAVVEVLAEPAFADEHVEWAIGRRDQAEVDVNRLIATQALEPAFLKHTQQLGLCHQRHVADLVKEQGTAVGQLKAARLAVMRAGKGALFVAEDFRLEQAVGQGRAVHGLEVLGSAPRQFVNHARDHFLARAGRAQDQDRDVGLGGGADPLEDRQHLLVAADHFAEALHRRRGFFDAEVGAAFEKHVQQLCDGFRVGPHGAVGRGVTRVLADDAELDQFADAVVDVLAHAPEGLHDRFVIERLLWAGREETQDSGAQRRLHQGLEARLEVGGLATMAAAAGAVPACREGQVIHATPRQRMAYRRSGSTASGTARSVASCGSHRPCGAHGTPPGLCRRSSQSGRWRRTGWYQC